jgi:hypothetical protein
MNRFRVRRDLMKISLLATARNDWDVVGQLLM